MKSTFEYTWTITIFEWLLKKVHKNSVSTQFGDQTIIKNNDFVTENKLHTKKCPAHKH